MTTPLKALCVLITEIRNTDRKPNEWRKSTNWPI